jgi:hypothetical protein
MAGLNRLDSQGDGQVGFAHPRRTKQKDIFSPANEAEPCQLPDDFPVDAGLEGKIKLLQGLQPREAGQLQACLDRLAVSASPFSLQSFAEEVPVTEVLLARLFAQRIELREQMFHFQLFQQVV